MGSEGERIGAGAPGAPATPHESAETPAPEAKAQGDKGLKKGAIGFVDGLAIGLDSTAPAYSLAAVIGAIVVAVGVQAPGVLLLSFVPMFFIAAAFYYMNRPSRTAARASRGSPGRSVLGGVGWAAGPSARPGSSSSGRWPTSPPSTCSTSSGSTGSAIHESPWSDCR
jgi:hypothetical protein